VDRRGVAVTWPGAQARRVAALRTEISEVVDALLRAPRASVTLDELAEALGVLSVSHAEIDALIDALEARGVLVAPADEVDLPGELGRVLAAARALAPALGRRPTSEEIAARAGLPPASVRRALLFARVLARG
jgi:hypothetical protein